MQPVFKATGPVLAVSEHLLLVLTRLIKPCFEQPPYPQAITLNFRDPDYSADHGGYHPVEIRLERRGEQYELMYITDFAYVGQGSGYAELAKALDFDWSQNCFEMQGLPPESLEKAKDLYPVFEENFLSYYLSGVFEVEVTHET